MIKNKRVVVTGMGLLSAIGNNVLESWKNAVAGKNGIETLTDIDTSIAKYYLAGKVKEFNFDDLISLKEAKRLDRGSIMAIVSANEAINDARLTEEIFEKEDIGVCIGTGVGGISSMEAELVRSIEMKRKVSPYYILKMIPNMPAANISIYCNAKGPSLTITNACAAATTAIGESYRLIQRGDASVMITGGCEAAITFHTICGFAGMGALTKSTDKNRGSIPFDRERGGFVIGEGAGVLILEEYEHAVKRNAHIYAELTGYGLSSDAFHMTAPNGVGARKAIEKAIAELSIKPSKLYINAHGTGTPLNDKVETIAMKEVWGKNAYDISISSTKAMTGHALGASGAIEAILTVKSIEAGVIPPTINYLEPDPDCDLDYTPNKAIEKDIEYGMSNSFAFGGHNASILFRKFK